MSTEASPERPREGAAGHRHRRALLVVIALVALIALAILLPRARSWWDVQPLDSGVEGGSDGSMTGITFPHSLGNVSLVDAPKGVVETLPLQIEDVANFPITLDAVEQPFYPDADFGSGAAVRSPLVSPMRRVDKEGAPEGPTRPVAGFVLRPGASIEIELRIRALGCDSTKSTSLMSTQDLTVDYHRLGFARHTAVQLNSLLAVAYDGDTSRGGRLTCLLPPG